MTIDRTPTVRVHVRERGGKRNFYPAPRNPDLAACYWLRYEKDGKDREPLHLALYAEALRHDDERARAAANRQERYTLGPQLVKTA
jgi:hypothetical protein